MTRMDMPIYVSIFSQELMLRRKQLVMTSQIGKHKREFLVILFPDKQPIILNMLTYGVDEFFKGRTLDHAT